MKKNLQTKFSTRQYMLSKDFEIYYYNDLDRSKVTSHKHDYYEFYFFIEGDVSLNISGTVYSLQHGDVVLIPPHITHRTIINSNAHPYRRFVFWITPAYLGKLLALYPSYGYIMQHAGVNHDYIFHNDVISFNALQSKIFRLIDEIHSERFGKDAAVSILVSELLLHLNRMVYDQNNPRRAPEDEGLYEAVSGFLEDHLDEDLSLDRLAKEFYVSKYYLSHLFKENTGLSIHQYIIKKRLTACRDAINSNSEISETYSIYGFRDYSSFYKAFKKEFGISPRECRRKSKDFS